MFESKKEKNSSDDDAVKAVIGLGAVAIALALGLLALKYSPVILLGILIGISINQARWLEKAHYRVLYVTYSVLFFALVFYFLLGLPPELHQEKFWKGFIFYFDFVRDAQAFLLKQWNELVPDLLKGLRIKKVTEGDTRHYFWISFYLGCLFPFITAGLRLFGKFNLPFSEPVFKIFRTPSLLFEKLLVCLFYIPLKITQEAPPGTAVVIFFVYIFIGASFLQKIEPIIAKDSGELLALISLIPFLGLLTGFLFRISSHFPFLKSLFELFQSFASSKTPKKGIILGRSHLGSTYSLSERNLGYHVEIVAPTGSGKTNLIKNIIAQRIAQGHGIIFLDFKAEFEIVSWLYGASKQFNRENEIRLFSLSNRDLSVPYNPLKTGDATQIHSALMNAMTWSESFYRGVASMALMTLVKSLCEYRDKTGELFHLGHLYELLDQPATTRLFADQMASLGCPTAPKLSELASRIEKPSERSNLMGLMSNLNQLLFSSAGELLSHDVTHGSFDFREAIWNGRISILLMNSLKLKESAQLIGKMILQDLMSFVGDHYSQVTPTEHKPITLITDEFAAFAMPNFIEFMDRARGAGIGIIIAHQARADLKSVSPEFQERIEANANTTLVSGVKNSDDAQYYASMLGTKTTTKETIQKKSDFLFGDTETGIKSVREVEEFVLHPNKLRELSQGEVFAISRTVDPKWGLVKVFKAPEFAEQTPEPKTILSHLKAIRTQYQNEANEHYLGECKIFCVTSGFHVRPHSQEFGHQKQFSIVQA